MSRSFSVFSGIFLALGWGTSVPQCVAAESSVLESWTLPQRVQLGVECLARLAKCRGMLGDVGSVCGTCLPSPLGGRVPRLPWGDAPWPEPPLKEVKNERTNNIFEFPESRGLRVRSESDEERSAGPAQCGWMWTKSDGPAFQGPVLPRRVAVLGNRSRYKSKVTE